MSEQKTLSQFPSVRKPWLRYYTEKEFRIRVPQCTVYDLMHSRNAHNPHRTALVYGDVEINYDSMFRSVKTAACAFSALGVVAGDIVTICAYSIPEVVYSFYALNMLGAVCNMIDPRSNDDRIRRDLEMTGSRIALVWEEAASRFLSFWKDGGLEDIVLLSPSDSKPVLCNPEDFTRFHRASERVLTKRGYVSVAWTYHDLEQKLTYKARKNRQMVIKVPPAFTSQKCPVCGHTDKNNRDRRNHRFWCLNCGYLSNDDRVAAMNLQRKGSESLVPVAVAEE